MHRTSLLVLKICFACIFLKACATDHELITSTKVLNNDGDVFELITRSLLDEERFSKVNLLISSLPLSSDSSTEHSSWRSESDLSTIQKNRVNIIESLNMTEVELEKYNSCYFSSLVPPPPSGQHTENELPEFCHVFESKFALAISIPENLTENDTIAVQVVLFTNYGYTSYRYIISNSTNPRILNREKIGWVYS